MVELALALPILILLVAGMMEFGQVIHQYLVVTEAAREGARSAAVGNDDIVITSIVRSAAATIDQGNLEVSINPGTRVRGNSVTVSVSNPVQIITPLISAFFPANPYIVQATAVMRVE
jgi:Flp pilus assembly protein TadG